MRSAVNSRLPLSLMAMALSMAWSIPMAHATVDLAQKPLIASAGSNPKPNLMLSVDTSGSMARRHMPEVSNTVNGKSLTTFGNGLWLNYPTDTYEITDSQNNNAVDGVLPAYTSTQYNLPTAALRTQIYGRSPQVNTIYYDPSVRYRPWASPEFASGRYPDASFTKAYTSPLLQGINPKTAKEYPSINLGATYTYAIKWCGLYSSGLYPSNNNCSSYNLAQTPAIVYMLTPTSADPTVLSNFKRWDIFGSGPFPGKNTYPEREDCSDTACTVDQERQNYANWFVYYRTRMLSTQAALSEAFYDMDNVVRVGWTTIRYAQTHRWGQSRIPIIQGVKDLSADHRKLLLSTVQDRNDTGYFKSSNATELRIMLDQVGQYFTAHKMFSPWLDAPLDLGSAGSTATPAANASASICRRSYNMLVTDGYYNDNLNDFKDVTPPGDVDSGNNTYENYTRATPYRDKPTGAGYSNTLADFALKYWATDLSPIDDGIKVRDSSIDDATWQHLTQFTVGLGVAGTLPATDATLAKLKAGELSWPNPTSNSTLEKIDDLWHAAVNSRGAHYDVRTSSDLVRAVQDMVNRATGESLRETGVATASAFLIDGNVKFVPEYDSGQWTGELYAFKLNALGAVVNPDGSNVQPGEAPVPLWKANNVLPGPAKRSVYTQGDAAGALVPFLWDEMGTANMELMSSVKQVNADVVNYLRGERSLEGFGSSKLRTRKEVLADFINSTPVYTKGGVDMGYGALSESTASSYALFQGLKNSRSNPMIFVGSNGGMLHGFATETGIEQFAYVARGVLPYLYKLGEQSYGKNASSHRFYVDGPLSEHDVYTANGWENILVGSLGSGGKGLFAFKLPVGSDSGLPQLKWDLTSNLSGAAADYIGNMHSRAEAGVLPNGDWLIFAANGINSAKDEAALLLIAPDTGAVTAVPVDGAKGNGLTGLAVVRNAKREVVAVYAGDLKGRVWRFEYDSTLKTMVLGYGGRHLFAATAGSTGDAQPITSAPTVYRYNNKQMVLFGTGRLWSEADRTDTQMQSFYGVLDEVAAEDSSSGTFTNDGPVITRQQLVNQDVRQSDLTNFLNVSTNQQTSDSKGWVLDLNILTADGGTVLDKPRVLYAPQLVKGFVYFSAITPAPDAAECDETEGVAYGFLLPALSGAQYAKPVFDTDGNGVVDDNDANNAGYAKPSDGPSKTLTGGDSTDTTTGEVSTGCSLQGGNSSQTCKVYTQPPPEETCETNPSLPECTPDTPEPPTSFSIQDRVWQRIQAPPDRTPVAP